MCGAPQGCGGGRAAAGPMGGAPVPLTSASAWEGISRGLGREGGSSFRREQRGPAVVIISNSKNIMVINTVQISLLRELPPPWQVPVPAPPPPLRSPAQAQAGWPAKLGPEVLASSTVALAEVPPPRHGPRPNAGHVCVPWTPGLSLEPGAWNLAWPELGEEGVGKGGSPYFGSP